MNSIKNLVLRLTGKSDAVATWRQHFTSSKETVHNSDLQIINEHARLKDLTEKAEATYNADRTRENYANWHDARQTFNRCNGNFVWWNRTVAPHLPRIEAMLDVGLAVKALRAAEIIVTEAAQRAREAADQLGELGGVDTAGAHAAIARKFDEKSRNLQLAQTSIAKIAVTDRGCFPRGLYQFNDYLEAALAP